MRRRSGLRRPWLAAAALALVAGGCMPQPATTQARDISNLYTVFLVAAAIVAAIVWGLVSWSVLRYRHKPRAGEALPPQYQNNLLLEAIWTGLPILTVIGLFGLTFVTINQVQAVSPETGVSVHVEAFQWQWRFTYTGSGVTVTGQIGQAPPELVVPVGQPIHVLLTSADVNHAFFVPAFLFKRDAIPGHPNTFDFTVMNPGTYNGQCAEFCGVFHDRMTFSVRAVSAADFSSWLAAAKASATPVASPSPSSVPETTPTAPIPSLGPPSTSPSTQPSASPS